MADWSQLPKDLLQLILEKLKSEIYLIRFRSVCSTWRFSIPKLHNHFPLNLPHFSNSNSSGSYIHKLYKHSIFLIKPPTTPNQPTLRSWLIRISPTSSGKFNLCHPLLLHSLIPSCMLDFNQLSVLNIEQMYICGVLHPNSTSTIYDRFVATFQGEEVLEIVTPEYLGRKLVMLRPGDGDDSWTKIPNEANFYHDICIYKGRPCVTDETGRTVMIESDLSVHLVAESLCDSYLDGKVNIMVENESELLLVHKYKYLHSYCISIFHYEWRIMIDVYRLDQKEKKWLKLENLGDTIVFFGQYDSFTASALDLGFDKGNFVIYCSNNEDHDVKSEMSIFHLDTRCNFPLSDYLDYLKLFWPHPEWIVSRCL